MPPLSWLHVDVTIESLGGENGVLLGLAVVGVGVLCRRVRRNAPGAWKAALVVAWVMVPLLVVLAVSVVKPMYADRYLIVVLPALALSAASVITAAGRATAIVALAATIAFSLAGVRRWYEGPIEQDWRAAASIVDQRAAPADAILVVPDFLILLLGTTSMRRRRPRSSTEARPGSSRTSIAAPKSRACGGHWAHDRGAHRPSRRRRISHRRAARVVMQRYTLATRRGRHGVRTGARGTRSAAADATQPARFPLRGSSSERRRSGQRRIRRRPSFAACGASDPTTSSRSSSPSGIAVAPTARGGSG